MRHFKQSTGIAAVLLTVGLAQASFQQIAYTGGKQVNTFTVSMYSGSPGLGQHAPSPDTVKIGSIFSLRFYAVPSMLAVCGAPTRFGMQFLIPGTVQEPVDTTLSWSDIGTYAAAAPFKSLDSVPGGWSQNPQPSPAQPRAPGFDFMDAGQRNTCDGAQFSLLPRWNRAVLVQRGSGVVYTAKVSIRAYADTSFGMLPYYQMVQYIEVRYVLNQNSADLADPVAILPAPGSRSGLRLRLRAGMEYDLYNPLGIRLKRGAGKFEAAVPDPRAPRPQ